MPRSFLNTPICAPRRYKNARVFGTSEIKKNKDKYSAIPIGNIAYLWEPKPKPVGEHLSLIILSHGGKAVDRKKRLLFRDFTVPSGFNLNFFCVEGGNLQAPKLNEIYSKISKAKVIDHYAAGMTCPEYILRKSTSSKYTDRKSDDDTYETIQYLMDNRSRTRDELIRLKNREIQRNQIDLEQQQNILSNAEMAIHDAENDTFGFQFIGSLEKERKEAIEELEELKENQRKAEKHMRFLQAEARSQSYLLTIRNPGKNLHIRLSKVLSKIANEGYKFSTVMCIFCRGDGDVNMTEQPLTYLNEE